MTRFQHDKADGSARPDICRARPGCGSDVLRTEKLLWKFQPAPGFPAYPNQAWGTV